MSVDGNVKVNTFRVIELVTFRFTGSVATVSCWFVVFCQFLISDANVTNMEFQSGMASPDARDLVHKV